MGLNDSEGSVPSLACRGLGMQRSVKSQALTLHRGPIVLHSQSIANPHKARAFCCLCLFHLALDVAGFTSDFYFCARFYLLFTSFYLLFYGWLWLNYGSLLPLWSLCFPIMPRRRGLYTASVWWGLSGEAVFSLSTHPTLSQTPVGCKVTTLGLVWPHQSKKRQLWTACPIIWDTGLPCL